MRSYLSDEELRKFIADIEQEPLYAPGHLKEEIMTSLKKQDIISVQKLRQAKVQMFAYSMKIVTGMAAALLLAFMLPQMPTDYLRGTMEENRREDSFAEKEYRQETSAEGANRFTAVLQKGTDAINSTSDEIYNVIMSFDRLFEKEEEIK